MMAYSHETLAYQGEGTDACNFQLIEDSTATAVLNQKMQQLLTVPESTAPPDLDAFTTAETSTMLMGSSVHHSSPTQGYTRDGIPSVSWIQSTMQKLPQSWRVKDLSTAAAAAMEVTVTVKKALVAPKSHQPGLEVKVTQ